MAKRKKNKKSNFSIQLDAECVVNPLKITKQVFTIGELADGYSDKSIQRSGEIVAFGGKLNVRPSFQRSYVVETKRKWKAKLINSILNNRPIGLVYFGITDSKMYSFILIDGQQRLITLCEFVQELGKTAMPFTINGETKDYFFKELPPRYQEKILNYELEVHICEGSEEEIYNWFQTINQESTILLPQELRNVAYTGQWLEDAKYYFSATRASDRKEINDNNSRYCAKLFGDKLDPTRQECLELALDWISYKVEYDKMILDYPSLTKEEVAEEICNIDKDDRIRAYMFNHRHCEDASELISFYKKVIDWAYDVFFHNGLYSTQTIKSQPWGKLYAMYSNLNLSEKDKKRISKRCELICSDGATTYSKSTGIYEWVIRGEKDDEIKNYLDLRGFKDEVKQTMWEKQGHRDPLDGKEYPYEKMESHHIISWKDGGRTLEENLVMLSSENHRKLHRMGYEITSSQLRNRRDDLIRKNQYSKDRELEYALVAA